MKTGYNLGTYNKFGLIYDLDSQTLQVLDWPIKPFVLDMVIRDCIDDVLETY